MSQCCINLERERERERERSFSPCSTAMPALFVPSSTNGTPVCYRLSVDTYEWHTKKMHPLSGNSSSRERWTSALIPFSECLGPFRIQRQIGSSTRPCIKLQGNHTKQSDEWMIQGQRDVFSRVGGSHVSLASCFLNLVTF
jgi:hypothetical protein